MFEDQQGGGNGVEQARGREGKRRGLSERDVWDPWILFPVRREATEGSGAGE